MKSPSMRNPNNPRGFDSDSVIREALGTMVS
ncbi:hypothetical protein V6Z12_D03G067900 [Gossypium hirsutum]